MREMNGGSKKQHRGFPQMKRIYSLILINARWQTSIFMLCVRVCTVTFSDGWVQIEDGQNNDFS